jgi:polyhydroxyalkanoate synthesis regulator phasin
MRKAVLMGLTAAALLAVPTANAEDAGRYVFDKSENGIVRLDTQTGEMSSCEQKAGQLTCRPAVEEKQASESEIERLNQKVDRLEKQLADLEKRVVSPKDLLPSDAQVDRTLGIMERFFRRFLDIVRDFDNTFQQDQQPKAAPEKT